MIPSTTIWMDFASRIWMTFLYIQATLSKNISNMLEKSILISRSELYVKLEKCQFHVEETKFLDYIITPKDVTMDPDHVKIIVD